MQMITVTHINSPEQFAELAPVWNEMLEGTENATVYQTYEWLASWWNTIGKHDAKLYVLLIIDNEKPIGIAPLMLISHKRSLSTSRIIRFIGTPDIDYGDLIGKDRAEIARATIEYLWNNCYDWNLIDLSQIRESSPALKVFGEYLSEVGAYYRIVHIETSLTFEYDGDPKKQSSHLFPKSEIMRRSAKYFAKAGKFELTEYRSAEDIKRRLERLFHYHVIRWQGTDTPSKFLDCRYRDFYRELVESLAPRGNISLFEMSLDGLPQAWCLDFDYRGAIYIYTPLYSMLHRHKAPGNLLFCLLPEYHIQHGHRMIDFGRGAQGNKQDFSNRSIKSYSLELFRSPFSLIKRNLYSDLKALPAVQSIITRRAILSAKSQLRMLLDTHGVRGTITTLLRSIGRKIVTVQAFRIYESDPRLIPIPKQDIPVEFRLLSAEHLNEIASFLGLEARSDKYAQMAKLFSKGADCFAVYLDNTLISLGWGADHSLFDTADNPTPKSGKAKAELFDWYTSPLYEKEGVDQFRLSNELNYYSGKGLACRLTISGCDSTSLHSAKNLGLKLAHTDRSVTAFGVRLRTASPPSTVAIKAESEESKPPSRQSS